MSLLDRAVSRAVRWMGGAVGDASGVAPALNPTTSGTDASPLQSSMGVDVAWSESLIYSAYNWPKYNPDDLVGRKGYDIYKRMMRDEQVKAVVRFKRDAVTGRKFYFEHDESETLDDEDVGGAGDAAGDVREGPEDDQGPAAGKPATGGTAEVGDDKAGKPKGGAKNARFLAQDPGAQPKPPAQGDQPPGQPGAAEGAPPAGQVAPEKPVNPAYEEMEKRCELLTKMLNDMDGSFLDALNGMMSSMYNGFSMTEKVFEPMEYDGETWLGIKRLRVKPYESFFFYSDEFGNLKEVVQRWQGKQKRIDMEKFVHHVENPDVDPHYGQSELREAYRAWFSKDIVLRLRNIFLERHAAGFVWIQPKENGSMPRPGTVEYAALVDVISNITAKTAILLPGQLELHYETPAQTDQFEKAITYDDKAIAKALLVPNLLGISEQGSTGAYAQSQTQLEAFLWTLDTLAARLEETINEQLIKHLGDLNWGDGKYPRFRFKPVSETVKMALIKTWLEAVGKKAVQTTDTDEAHVRELLDFPPAGDPVQGLQPQLPMPGDPSADPSADPNAPGAQRPGSAAKPPQKTPTAPPKGDETVRGKGTMKSARTASFTKAVKRVDFAVIDVRSTAIATQGFESMREPLADLVQGIKDAFEKLDLLNNPEAIREVKPTSGAMSRLRNRAESTLREAWGLGQRHARNEMTKVKAARFAVEDDLLNQAAEKFLQSRAFTLAGDTYDGIRKKATNILYNGIKGQWALAEIYDRIDAEVGSAVLPHLATGVRTAVFEAINEARYEFFASPEVSQFVEALEYSAIIDGRTTEICQHLDGKVYPVASAVWDQYTPPNHFNCRSLLIAVTVDDNWEESDPPEVDTQDGFGS